MPSMFFTSSNRISIMHCIHEMPTIKFLVSYAEYLQNDKGTLSREKTHFGRDMMFFIPLFQ